MSLVAHRLGHVEFWIFVFGFFGQVHLKKSKQIFDILNFYLFKIFFGPIIRNMFRSVMEKTVFFLFTMRNLQKLERCVCMCVQKTFFDVCAMCVHALFWGACDVQLDFLHTFCTLFAPKWSEIAIFCNKQSKFNIIFLK